MGNVTDFIKAKKSKNPKLRIGALSDVVQAQVHAPTSTGNIVADYVTSIGGIPRGVITEVRGPTGSGKTTLAAQTAAQHQKAVREGRAKGAILFLDFEFAVDETYFSNLGVDVEDQDTFVYYQPDFLEEGMQMFIEMAKSGLLAYGIIDSVASASAEEEYLAEVGKRSVGLRARVYNQAFRMAVGPMRTTGTGLVLVNHVQNTIPMKYGEISRPVSPGGVAIEYYTSLRLDMSKPGTNKEEVSDELTRTNKKLVTSTDVRITAFKNKLGDPYREGSMRVKFGKGFDPLYSAFNILVDHSVIKKKGGGHFTIPEQLLPEGFDSKLPAGMNNVLELIEKDSAWSDLIKRVATQLVLKHQTTVEDTSIEILDIEDDDIDPDTGEVRNAVIKGV